MEKQSDDYFFETERISSPHKVLVLIIYDIIDNRKRTKFAKYLSGYGIRVQKSAFEARLTDKKYRKLIKDIPSFCGEDDSIRIYRIIGESHVSVWGIREIPEDAEDVIVI